jgi:prepilin-type processing-associated H-X9-DG protein
MDAEREQVRTWVESMDAQGYTSDEIRAQLALAGWSKQDIEELMGAPVAPPLQPAVAPPAIPPPAGPAPPVQPAPQALPPVMQAPPIPQPPGALPPTPGYAQAPMMAPEIAAPAQPTGLATAALVLGLVSLLFGPLTAIIGLILGIVAMKRGDAGRTMAMAGVIISAVILLAYLVLAGLLILGFSLAGSASSNKLEGAPKVDESSDGTTSDSKDIGKDEIAPDEAKPGNSEALVPGKTALSDARAVCLTRVKALASGMLMYAADYDGALPDATGWPLGIQPYVKDQDSFLCPADDRVDPQDPGGRPTGYTMYEPMTGLYLNSLKEKGKAYLLFDGTEVAGEEGAAAFRHDGGLNLAYVDGHTKWVGEARFKQPD